MILVVPAAGKSSRYPNMRPKWLLTHPTGDIMIKKVLDALNYEEFDRVIISVLREHCINYHADTILQQVFGNKIEILILERPTSSPAETVYVTIKKANINGQLVIKDSDCVVRADLENVRNAVVGMEIDNRSDVDRIQTKSFIIKNDDNVIVDILEKKIVSNIICLGVYSVDAKEFVNAFREVCNSPVYKKDEEIYVSHIISYLIVEKQKIFTYIKSEEFIDWGTKEEWTKERSKFKTYIFDIDGVLLRNYGKCGSKNWSNTFEPIEKNIQTLKQISDEGHQIIFMTSRSLEYLGAFQNYMQQKGIKYKELITDCFHGKRIIVNDFANTNPWPSCEAISIPRNGPLEDYIL